MSSFVSGFTFIKHGLSLGYPIKESILSIEPLCDEIVINIGFDDPELKKDDGTEEFLRSTLTHPKFKFVKSWWDPAKRSNGSILAEQTNIALSHCTGKICQYIQGDEALHEKDLSTIMTQIEQLDRRKDIDGLIFNYLHFYGNVDIIKFTRTIYRRELRTIRNGLGIKSWLDAQGFRHANNTKIYAKQIDATVYHYGWARQESVMKEKVLQMDKLYHGENFVAKKEFEYKKIFGLHPFKGSHPEIMKSWIDLHRNNIDILNLKPSYDLRNASSAFWDFVERQTGYRLGEYKNFRLKS